MALKRCIVEMGTGVDLHGRDYTKAARRAVKNAMRHNSLGFARVVGQSVDAMHVEVTIGVPQPDAVDRDSVLAVLPHGQGQIHVVHGSLEIPNEAGTDATVMANAALVVSLDV
jgi:uncharacterized protein (TIGR02058 family)